MRKNFTTLICSLLFVLATIKGNAQLERGNVLIGGDIMSMNLGLDEGGNFNVLLNPKAAWFIKDNVAIGGYMTFGLNTAKNAGTGISYGLGALGRYYFNREQVNLMKQTRFFVEANAGIEGDNPAVGDNTNGLGIGVGPGIAYFISPNIALEGLLKYNLIIGFGSSVTSNNLNLGLGFQIYLPTARLRRLKEEMK